MHNFVSIKEIDTICFDSCSGCLENCCSGRNFKFIPLILDDFIEVYEYFKIYFAKVEDSFTPVMQLAEENSGCKYFKDSICTIYEKRPPGCRLYPISPYYDDILIDLSCKAVGDSGEFLASKDRISSNFYHKRLENFNKKREKTINFVDSIKDDLVLEKVISNIELYIYNKKLDNIYIQLHQSSLSSLN
jgi:Fe-S-cluster containining protein